MPTQALLAILAAIAIYSGMMLALARFGGWRTLAARYPGQDPAERGRRGWWERGRGNWWGLSSLRLRWWAGYNLCILWRADGRYLHLRVVPPFNIFHPPMSIPVEELHVVRRRSWYVQLQVGGLPLYLSRRVADRALQAAAQGSP
jgi:hypothetical protein